MLSIIVPDAKFYDRNTRTFSVVKGGTLQLEHSLLSLSKWEAETEKPFLKRNSELTYDESILYVKCMTINNNVKPEIYTILTQKNMDEISNYISRKMTATTFSDNQRPSREIITAELIYYWMFELHIPKECEKWHLNKLLTQIRLCSIKNAPPKKMSHNEMLRKYDSINDMRRKALHSKG